MQSPLERAQDLLDRRTAISVLASANPDGQPDTCLLIAARFDGEGRIAGGEEEHVAGNVFRNLRQNAKASILVLDPIMDPRARDGVRVECEFLGAELDGTELGTLNQWLETFAPGRKVKRRLIFRVLSVERYRPAAESPAIIE